MKPLNQLQTLARAETSAHSRLRRVALVVVAVMLAVGLGGALVGQTTVAGDGNGRTWSATTRSKWHSPNAGIDIIRLENCSPEPLNSAQPMVADVQVPAPIFRAVGADGGAERGQRMDLGQKNASHLWLPNHFDIVLKGRLNDVEVGDIFRQAGPARLRAELSATHGLKHGHNELVVEGQTTDGRVESQTMQFFVPYNLPLAAAGLDVRVLAGSDVHLDGSKSLPGVYARMPLRFQWKIVSAPGNSKAWLLDADRAQPTLHVDIPGVYEIELSVFYPFGRLSRTSLFATDSLTVTVTPQASVPFQTVFENDVPDGVQVAVDRVTCGSPDAPSLEEPCYYANQDGSAVQVLVLNREDLTLVSNRSYATLTGSSLNGQIGGLGTGDDLVIILGQYDLTDPDATLVTLLNNIGVDIAAGDTIAGPYSIIGIPGSIPGKAYVNDNLTLTGQQPGEIKGFLKYAGMVTATGGVDDNRFVFSFDDVVSYGVSRGYINSMTNNTVRIGNLQRTGGGSLTDSIQIVTFDRLNLSILSNQIFVASHDEGINWADVGTTLSDARSNKQGVVIASIGQMSGFSSEPEAAALMSSVLPAIKALGGSPDVFLRAVNQNATYSFIGVEGIGYQSSSVLAEDVPSGDAKLLPIENGEITGILRRGTDMRLFPQLWDPNGLSQSDGLLPIVYQALSAWPMTPDNSATTASGEEVALAWLAQNAFTPGIDTGTDLSTVANVRQVALALRANYPTSWTPVFNASIAYPGSDAFSGAVNANVSETDFENAVQQIALEIGQRTSVQNWFDTLNQAFVQNQAQLITTLQTVATNVQVDILNQSANALLEAASSSWVAGMVSQCASGIAKVAVVFQSVGVPGLSQLIAVLNFAGAAGNAVLASQEGPATATATYFLLENELDQDAIEIDQQVVNAVTAQETGVGLTEQIVLSDWDKMNEVALKSNTSIADGGWELTEQDVTNLSNVIIVTARQQAYRAWAAKLFAAAQVDLSSALGSPSDASSFTCAWCECESNPFAPACSCHSDQPFGGASSGPSGFGNAQQYWPQTSIRTSGNSTIDHLTYVMYDQSWHSPGSSSSGLDDGKTHLANHDVVVAIFGQPASDSGDGDTSSSTNGGLIAPLFWTETFDMTEGVGCDGTYQTDTCSGGTCENGGIKGNNGLSWSDTSFY